jgi:hypothetical protein
MIHFALYLLLIIPRPQPAPRPPQPVEAIAAAPRPAKGRLPLIDAAASDGDSVNGTIVLPYGLALHHAHARLTGYDAWESRRIRRTRGKITPAELRRGKAAKAELARLLTEAKAAWLEPDPAQFDAFGRPLGRLYLEQANGRILDVARWMIAHDHDRDTRPDGKPRR